MPFVKLVCISLLAAACAPIREYRPVRPPASEPMGASRALGRWASTFGEVAIEPDGARGGLATGSVRGRWSYAANAAMVNGSFEGTLRGNVLQLGWVEEGTNEILIGGGFLVFDAEGRSFAGTWWSTQRDRMGHWQGWRETP